jgi:hypothetical protein
VDEGSDSGARRASVLSDLAGGLAIAAVPVLQAVGARREEPRPRHLLRVIAPGRGGADDPCELRRLGVTAATLLLAAAVGCTGSREARAHTCSAKDRHFLQTAGVDMTAFGLLRQDLTSGSITPQEASRAALDAAKRVAHVEPSDPALRAAQRYLDGMFTEFGEAVKLHGEGKDARERMYRAFILANGVHEVLAKAQPALQREGCNVAGLL